MSRFQKMLEGGLPAPRKPAPASASKAFIIAPASHLMNTQSDSLLLVIHQNCSYVWRGPEIDSVIPATLSVSMTC